MGKSMWQKNLTFIRIWSKFWQCLMSKLLWNSFKAKLWFINLICFRVSSLKGQSLSNNVTKFSFVPSFITFAKGELNNTYPSTAKDMTKDEFNQLLLKFLKDTEGEYIVHQVIGSCSFESRKNLHKPNTFEILQAWNPQKWCLHFFLLTLWKLFNPEVLADTSGVFWDFYWNTSNFI